MHRILILPEFRQIWKLDTGNPDIFFNITKIFFVKNTEVPQIVRKIETKLFCDSIEEKVLVGQKLGESCKGGGGVLPLLRRRRFQAGLLTPIGPT